MGARDWAPNRTIMRHTLWIAIVLGLLAVGLSACDGDEPLDSGDVAVEDLGLYEDAVGAKEVAGEIHNRSDKTIQRLIIRVALYDGDGVQIETMNIEIQEVPPEDYVPFSQHVDTDADVQSARVHEILDM